MMATQEDKKAEVKKGGKPKPPGFKLNGYAPVIQIDQQVAVESVSMIFHDPGPLRIFAGMFAAASYHDHESFTANPVDELVWRGMVMRMIYLMMAKQLAHTVSESDSLEGVKAVEYARRVRPEVPVGLMVPISQYGRIREATGNYNLAGQPFLCLTYLMRAIHPSHNEHGGLHLEINRETDIFINTASPRTIVHAKEWLVRLVQVWAQTAPTITLVQAGINFQVSVPILVSGATAYRGFLGDIFPAVVADALTKLAFLEAIPHGFVWDGARVGAAAGVGIQVVNYGRDQFDTAFQAYATEVQIPVKGTLYKNYAFEELKSCSDCGTLGQAIFRELPSLGFAPEGIPPKDADIGWMLSGGLNRAIVKNERISVTSKATPSKMMLDFFNNMRKQ